MRTCHTLGMIGVTLLMLAVGGRSFAQDNGGVYIDPNRSDPNLRRDVTIRGNQVEMYFANWGQVANRDVAGGGIWPRGTGHDHLHLLTPFMAARVWNGTSRVIVVSEGYDQAKRDPITNIDQKFQPIPGYLNNTRGQNELANQLNPTSWPAQWPGRTREWDGYWNGYFGLNQKNADQEAYFVMDDSWNNKIPFYPSSDTSRRGLGLQIEVRAFQWSHSLAQDVVFMHYQVSNTGNYAYTATGDSLYFGAYADINAGGSGGIDDDADFDASLNLVYAWDHDNIGVARWSFRNIPPGYMGWKFLESPGMDGDLIDNDGDGITDEKRDNPAGTRLTGAAAVVSYIQSQYNAGQFLSYFKYPTINDVPAVKSGIGWTGDENFNWVSYADLSGNGTWDPGEPLNDDKGADGIGPGEEGYPGPDADGTEANGQPDQGEPNFGKTDKDESDQVGLASFSAPNFGSAPINDEANFWPRIRRGTFLRPPLTANQYWIFSAGPFNLAPGKTERFSTCFVFGQDKDAIYRASTVSQIIYNSGYRFVKPPDMPNVKAIAGDRRVTLIWDKRAEFSYDPIFHNDFEGYKILKSTEPQFLEAKVITDAYGNAYFTKPMVQYDMVDGLSGMHPVASGEELGDSKGIHFYMGKDSGLQHAWVDTNVINGRTYYYAIVAYDRGYYKDFYDRGLSDVRYDYSVTPAESPASIEVSGGVIIRMSPNTASATPNPNPSNYVSGVSDANGSAAHTAGFSTGSVSTTVLATDRMQEGRYIVSFSDTSWRSTYDYRPYAYSVYDSTRHVWLKQNERLPAQADSAGYIRHWTAELHDIGLAVNFRTVLANPDSAIANSGWKGTHISNLTPVVGLETVNAPYYAMNCQIEFGDTNEVLDTAYTTINSVSPLFRRPVNFRVTEIGSGKRIPFIFEEGTNTKNGRVDTLEWIKIPIKRPNVIPFLMSWNIQFNRSADVPVEGVIGPHKGDVFRLNIPVPFNRNDRYEFTTTASVLRERKPGTSLDNVTVVPNPYVEAAIWEQQPALRGRGERKIYFNNLPASCTVRIYALTGRLLKELQHQGGSSASGSEAWDLSTLDGLEVATGLYIYHVDAGDLGSKVGKFAIVN